MSYEEFFSFYENNGKLPNDVSTRKNQLNERQIKSRYEKYIKSEEKKSLRQERLLSNKKDRIKEKIENNSFIDEKWENVKSQIDLSECMLVEKLQTDNFLNDLIILFEKSKKFIEIIDPAHVFGKGSYPHMKYDLDNIVPLNRYSHSCLDQNRHPITGDHIEKEEVKKWWKYIVGEETYENLRKRSIYG